MEGSYSALTLFFASVCTVAGLVGSLVKTLDLASVCVLRYYPVLLGDGGHRCANSDFFVSGAVCEGLRCRMCGNYCVSCSDQPDELRVALCLKTGKGGRTALHVAAMQGCFRLAKQVIDLVYQKYPDYPSCVTDPYYGEAVANPFAGVGGDFIEAIDGRSRLTAFKMADEIIGYTSISQYIRYMRKNNYVQGMYEAYEGTNWHTALAEGNCKKLMILLETNSRYLIERTWNGLSVFDVAIRESCEDLVKLVEGMFRQAPNCEISWHRESYFSSELKWEQIGKHSGFIMDGGPHQLSDDNQNKVEELLSWSNTVGGFQAYVGIGQLPLEYKFLVVLAACLLEE